jgi:hypothetical protein
MADPFACLPGRKVDEVEPDWLLELVHAIAEQHD